MPKFTAEEVRALSSEDLVDVLCTEAHLAGLKPTAENAESLEVVKANERVLREEVRQRLSMQKQKTWRFSPTSVTVVGIFLSLLITYFIPGGGALFEAVFFLDILLLIGLGIGLLIKSVF